MKTQNQNKEKSSSSEQSVKKEIEKVLTGHDISFEEIPDEESSPLNQPVVEKDLNNTPTSKSSSPVDNGQTSTNSSEPEEPVQETENLDAPEQDFKEFDLGTDLETEVTEMPIAHAQIAADTIIGVADNLLFEVGGGFFVTISKHKDFYEFEEVIEVIDEQNHKNVNRLKLDETDKLLLRPLLIQVVRKKAKNLTPEQQLAAAALSILVKKFKTAMEIRAENNILVERIRDIIRDEVRKSPDNNSDQTGNNTIPTEQNPELSKILEVA
jgi:hypothetical protein